MTTVGAPVSCITCRSTAVDRFCAACGEKRLSHHDVSIKHFVEHAFETLTHFDFKSLRAYRYLVTRPGFLTREHLDGRRRPYVGPVQLFVIANIVFAVIGGNTFRTPLAIQLHDRPAVAWKNRLADRAIAESGLTREEFARAFDAAAGFQGKTWVLAMIPMLALCLAALYGFRRYLYEHLVFSTHLFTFTLLLILAVSLGAFAVAKGFGFASRLSPSEWDASVSLLILVGFGSYLYKALRRTFRDGPLAAALRAVGVTVALYPMIVAYRFLLFFLTLRAT